MSKIINRYLSTAMVFTIDCVMFRHLTNRGRIPNSSMPILYESQEKILRRMIFQISKYIKINLAVGFRSFVSTLVGLSKYIQLSLLLLYNEISC